MKRGLTPAFCLIACAAQFLVAPTAAQAPPAAPGGEGKETKWKPDDILMAESAGPFRISPDGQWTVWVKSAQDKEKDGRISNLFLSSLTGKKEIQLTRGTEMHGQPRWQSIRKAERDLA